MSLSLTLSFHQTQKMRLSLDQKAILRELEEKLIQKAYGPEIQVTKDLMPGTDNQFCLSCKRDAATAFTIALDPENDIENKVKMMPAYITAASLYAKDTNLYLHILHYYGSITKAFAANGRVYNNAALEEWQTTVAEYLGILKDSAIAKITGKTTAAICAFRKKLGIEAATNNMRMIQDDEENFDSEILRIQADNIERLREFNEKHQKTVFGSAVREAINVFLKANWNESDTFIAEKLEENNIYVTRRMVNNYREDLTRGVLKET